MTIERKIHGETVFIELTNAELLNAYYVQRKLFIREDCEGALRCELGDRGELDRLDSMDDEQRANLIKGMADRYEEFTDYYGASHSSALDSALDDALADLDLI